MPCTIVWIVDTVIRFDCCPSSFAVSLVFLRAAANKWAPNRPVLSRYPLSMNEIRRLFNRAVKSIKHTLTHILRWFV